MMKACGKCDFCTQCTTTPMWQLCLAPVQTKCANGCTFFTCDDFTVEEVARDNKLAVEVCKNDRLLCKYCGQETTGAEADMHRDFVKDGARQ